MVPRRAPEEVRLQVLKGAERGGRLKEMEALVDQCMADYDENGWTGNTWMQPLDENELSEAAE